MPLLLGTEITEYVQPVTRYDRRYHQSDFIHQAEPEKTLALHGPSHQSDASVSRREYLSRKSLEIA
jgi:hypothetical protein